MVCWGVSFCFFVMFGWRILGGKEGAEIIKRKIWKHGMQKEELRRLLKFVPPILVRGLVNFVMLNSPALPKQNPRLETKALHLIKYLAFSLI